MTSFYGFDTLGAITGNSDTSTVSIIVPSNFSSLQESSNSFKLAIKNPKGIPPSINSIVLTSLSNTQKISRFCFNRNLCQGSQELIQLYTGDIPLIDCDQNVDKLNSIISALHTLEIKCSIFYSTTENRCLLRSDSEWFKKYALNVFTTASASDSIQLVSEIDSQGLIGTISKTSSSKSFVLFVAICLLIAAVLLLLGGICGLIRRKYKPSQSTEEIINDIPLVRVYSATQSHDSIQTIDTTLTAASQPQMPSPAYKSTGQDTKLNTARSCTLNVSKPGPATQTVSPFVDPFPRRTPLSIPSPENIIIHIRDANETYRGIALEGSEVEYARDAYPFPLLSSHHNITLGPISENQAASSNPVIPSRSIEFPSEPPKRHHWRLHRRPSSSASSSSPSKANSEQIGRYITEENDSCRICLEDFETGELLRELRCKHYFHATCIDPWLLKSSPKCPLCRGNILPIVPKGDEEFGDATYGEITFTYVKRRIRKLSRTLSKEHISVPHLPRRVMSRSSSSAEEQANTTHSKHMRLPIGHLKRSHTTPAPSSQLSQLYTQSQPQPQPQRQP